MHSLDFSIPPSRLASILAGGASVPGTAAVFRIEGSGAFTCLQGLLTCDLTPLDEGGLAWGAVLTPKGMIVFDAFVTRSGDRFTLVLDATARESALHHFRRTIPPRLAQVRDVTAEYRLTWELGPGNPPCRPELDSDGSPREEGDAEADLAAARILAGWPTLGREIDERTLPQEARFDELGGVSYSKGCYTGQETVARIHFRGHVNRTLRGVTLSGVEGLADRTLRLGGREVGVLRSTLRAGGVMLGLATIRREVEESAVLALGGGEARQVALPFPPDAVKA